MGRLFAISVAMIALMLGLGQFTGQMHPPSTSASGSPSGDASATAPPPRQSTADAYVAGDALGIARGEDGQFHLTAQVNGEDTSFLVDTGADVVALTVDDAERLGVYVDPAAFRPILQTASGKGYGQRVRLDSMSIGGRELDGVDAVVVDGLGMNLLGQSVLRRLGRVELQGDRLVIDPA